MHFILSGSRTSLHIFDHIHKKLQHNFPKMRGGGLKAAWNFAENSSDLVARPFLKEPWGLLFWSAYIFRNINIFGNIMDLNE